MKYKITCEPTSHSETYFIDADNEDEAIEQAEEKCYCNILWQASVVKEVIDEN